MSIHFGEENLKVDSKSGGLFMAACIPARRVLSFFSEGRAVKKGEHAAWSANNVNERVSV